MREASSVLTKKGTPAIECRGVWKRFGQLEAVRGANLTIRTGEITALLGDNGAGKTTLVKCISGAYEADEGEIQVYGQDHSAITSIRDAQLLGIQTVYQNLALCDDLSVVENVFLGREAVKSGWRGRLGIIDRRRMQQETADAVEKLGSHVPNIRATVLALSGGQRQAIAIVRALPWATTAIIMDEPTAALGARQRQIVYDVAQKAAASGVAVLVISHDIPQMLAFADHIAIMRQGVVVAERAAGDIRMPEVMRLMLGVTYEDAE